MTPHTKPLDALEQAITDLRTRSRESGQVEQAVLCNEALLGDKPARRRCMAILLGELDPGEAGFAQAVRWSVCLWGLSDLAVLLQVSTDTTEKYASGLAKPRPLVMNHIRRRLLFRAQQL